MVVIVDPSEDSINDHDEDPSVNLIIIGIAIIIVIGVSVALGAFLFRRMRGSMEADVVTKNSKTACVSGEGTPTLPRRPPKPG
ncbi:MAG: hypothetical protein ACMUHY_05335 [Thermoplasmatota archaeon]